MVKAANPRLRTLVTTTSTAAQEKDVVNMIDLWVPIINDLSLKRRRGSEQYCEQKAVSCTGTTPIDHDQRSHYNFVKPVSEEWGRERGKQGTSHHNCTDSGALPGRTGSRRGYAPARESIGQPLDVPIVHELRMRAELYLCADQRQRLRAWLALVCN